MIIIKIIIHLNIYIFLKQDKRNLPFFPSKKKSALLGTIDEIRAKADRCNDLRDRGRQMRERNLEIEKLVNSKH